MEVALEPAPGFVACDDDPCQAISPEPARYAALTSCMCLVNLGVIFAVADPVATTSVAARSAAQGRPAEVLRFQ
ncbi:MAG TPA: hypothetical protein VF877_03315 [Gaiellaceae bacterium]